MVRNWAKRRRSPIISERVKKKNYRSEGKQKTEGERRTRNDEEMNIAISTQHTIERAKARMGIEKDDAIEGE